MCSPVAAISGGLGVMQAVGSANAQQQQANAQYAANKAQRQQQINNQRLKLAVDNKRYRDRQVDRTYADNEATRAADEAYLGNQVKYNEKVKSFMSNKQNRLIKSMELAGVASAKGQRGGSVTAMQNAVAAATGRDTAMGLANLRSASTALITGNRNIQGKLQAEYMSNFSQIGDAPMQGFTPPEAVKPAGPSPLSIAANIGQATLGAFSAGQAANTLPGGQTMGMMGGNSPVPLQQGGTLGNFSQGFNFGI